MDYGRPVRKSPSLHTQKSNPNPKFIGTAEAYVVCHIGPKISGFFDLCLHWVSVVRDQRLCKRLQSTYFFFLLSQAKPMLNFQTDYDEATGEQVLTCFLLPQMEFQQENMGK